MYLNDFGMKGLELKETLDLRYEPIAINFANNLTDVPKEAIRPYRDQNVHYAMCQAITLVKTKGLILALTLEDQWCWKPPIAAGMVKVEEGTNAWDIAIKNCGVLDPQLAAANFRELPKLPYGSCQAIVIAPLSKINYKPDVILVYCHKATQINWFIGGAKLKSGKRLPTELDYMDSCIWSTIPTLQEGKMRFTLPDPGELDRAACPEDEMIISIPAKMFVEVADGAMHKLKKQKERLKNVDGTPKMKSSMEPDFPRPEFYTELYKIWGLESGGKIIWTEKER